MEISDVYDIVEQLLSSSTLVSLILGFSPFDFSFILLCLEKLLLYISL